MYLWPRIYKYLQPRSYCLYCSACCGGEERLRDVTYLLLKFLTVKTDPLNPVSHNVAFYKNVSATLNEDLLYQYGVHICSKCVLCYIIYTPSTFDVHFLKIQPVLLYSLSHCK
jgi:hypothetical protein